MDSDQILGNEEDVEGFVKSACDRLSCSLMKKKHGWLLPKIPDVLKPLLGDKSRLLSFTTPTPEAVEYVGRNHPLVEGLARYILENAMSGATTQLLASRCGFTTTDAVKMRTTLLLLRVRHLLNSPRKGRQGDKDNSPTPLLLAEECVVVGFTGSLSNPVWLPPQQAMSLLQQATPVSDAPQRALERLATDDLTDVTDELTVGYRDQASATSATSATKSAAKEAALLSLKIVDPACGSGHFVLAAARRIGKELALWGGFRIET